jgi:hypothetical protein
MRVITHQKLVNRNVKIGDYASGVGMLLLLGALVLNITSFTRTPDPQMMTYVFLAFIIGFTCTNVGLYFRNRWGRRPDRGLAESLKGLDDRFTLYNYRLGAAHVLVGPSQVMIFIPKYQGGAIAYVGDKWINPSGPRGFAKFFAADSLGNPAAEADTEAETFKNFIKKRAPELSVEPQTVIVFMHPRAEISAKDSPIPALHAKQLKEYVRRMSKGAASLGSAFTNLEEKLGLSDQ